MRLLKSIFFSFKIYTPILTIYVYLPIQNLENIFSRISSVVVLPRISSKIRRLSLRDSATISKPSCFSRLNSDSCKRLLIFLSASICLCLAKITSSSSVETSRIRCILFVNSSIPAPVLADTLQLVFSIFFVSIFLSHRSILFLTKIQSIPLGRCFLFLL